MTHSFEHHDVHPDALLDVLDEVVHSLDDARIPFLLIGGVASAALGRPRLTNDIDVFVSPADAPRTLHVLAKRGFDTQETDPLWLFKAVKDDVLVDVIFKAKGDIYLDQDMLSRAETVEVRGRTLRLVPAEDLIAMKALAHEEPTQRYWFDALGIVAQGVRDWNYLLRRARHGPRRILSLLIYAQSRDLLVPDWVIDDLIELIYKQPEAPSAERVRSPEQPQLRRAR